MKTSACKVRRRQIGPGDLRAVADLLCEGFPARSGDYWRRGLEALATRPSPAAYPRFGYMLEADGEPVGVILLIFSAPIDPSAPVRCNLSSWYVRDAFRGYAALLTAAALGLENVTCINSSPAAYTWPILESMGYARYGEGQFVAVPALSPRGLGARVREVTAAGCEVSLPEAELLADHARARCLSLVCGSGGEAAPFVFIRWRLGSRLKMMRLIYCRDTADFVRCAGPIGRFLLRRGVMAVGLDAVGPVRGLAGRYFPGAEPKYFRGPRAPRLNDLAFTESVLFGV